MYYLLTIILFDCFGDLICY